MWQMNMRDVVLFLELLLMLVAKVLSWWHFSKFFFSVCKFCCGRQRQTNGWSIKSAWRKCICKTLKLAKKDLAEIGFYSGFCQSSKLMFVQNIQILEYLALGKVSPLVSHAQIEVLTAALVEFCGTARREFFLKNVGGWMGVVVLKTKAKHS